MSAPLSDLRGPIKALFTDLDGTVTTGHRVEVDTFAALARVAARIPVVVVTGRGAGWGHAIATVCNTAAVITENGGLTFVPTGDGRLAKRFGVPESELPQWRDRMMTAMADVAAEIPGAALSLDSAYREVDLAVDWNEDASLTVEQANRVVEMLRERGLAASRSSVHVNFNPPLFDKRTACLEVIESVLGGSASDLSGYVYVGDSTNDAPAFGAFELSVGVANVRRAWDELSHKPRFVTEAEEGAGLREVIAHIEPLL